ncbi:MAG: homoserine dehydrogenase, partial [Luteimonas sp.]|nr:homoserine dehydrogenase [Luteimonas sp.]
MSTVLAFDPQARVLPLASSIRAPAIALLGTGTVGSAFVARCLRLQRHGVALPTFSVIANSRDVEACGSDPDAALQRVAGSKRDPGTVQVDADAFNRGDIVVDATASDDIAAQHADWLARGIHVVTAN